VQRAHRGRQAPFVTVAVAGKRSYEVIEEETAIDWERDSTNHITKQKKLREQIEAQ
jgi:hypothetical protein